MPHAAHLTFDASAELLSGLVGTHHFHVHAVSGGGRGATVAGVASERLTSHMATTKTIKQNGQYIQRGGTLPPGAYTCQYLANHPPFGECIRLHALPSATAIHSPFATMPIVHGRGGFYIHGRGPHGSDGCIVPLHHGKRILLNRAIRDYAGQVLLRVIHVPYVLPAAMSVAWWSNGPRGGGAQAGDRILVRGAQAGGLLSRVASRPERMDAALVPALR
mgnify:CR=1 FL=1